MLLWIISGCNGATQQPIPSNTVYLAIENATPDSGFAVIRKDSGGPVVREQAMKPGDSLCLTAVIVDSIYVNAGLWRRDSLYYVFGRLGGEGGLTISHQALASAHTFIIGLTDPGAPNTPYGTFAGYRGSGCP